LALARAAAAPIAGIAIAVVLAWQTRGLDEVARGDQLGPGFWPRLVLAGLALSCAAKLVVAWRRRRVRDGAVASAGSETLDPPEMSGSRLAAGIALILAYVVATPPLGFALTTALFIAGFMWLCGARSATAIGTSAVVGTVALLYVFIKLVYLPLPKGQGPVESVTLGLYRALQIF